MAIYHLNVKNGSRGGGQSAQAHAAYIERAGKYGLAGPDGVERDAALYCESGHMPAWAAGDDLAYWQAADVYERANGQLYKEVEFALPVELPAQAGRHLAVAFAHALTDAEHLPYTLTIHAGAGTNPHGHLMISERANDEIEREAAQWFKRANRAAPALGGALKTRCLQTKEWLAETRETWAAEANQALQAAGLAIQIDHRSYAAQGLDRPAGVHLGPHAHAMEQRGIETDRGNLGRAIAVAHAELRTVSVQLAAAEAEAEAPHQQRAERGPSSQIAPVPARSQPEQVYEAGGLEMGQESGPDRRREAREREEARVARRERAEARERADREAPGQPEERRSVDRSPPPAPVDLPPSPGRWEKIKARGAGLLGQVTERFAESKEEKARRQGVRSTAEALAAVPAREAPAKAARAVPEQLPPGWSVEKVAQDKALSQEISQIEDPQIRAEAERLLSGIKQEAEARQPRKELGKQLEKGFGLGDD